MITAKLLFHAILFVLLNSLLHQVLGHYDQFNTTSSSWLTNHSQSNWGRRRGPICRPWICRRSGPPGARMRCCRNQCVDVLSDPNHCRFCFRSCRFALSCCDGDCVDTNNDPSNCGRCGNECDSGAPCEFGMCGYAAPTSQPRRRRSKFHRRPRPPPSPDTDTVNKSYDHGRDEA